MAAATKTNLIRVVRRKRRAEAWTDFQQRPLATARRLVRRRVWNTEYAIKRCVRLWVEDTRYAVARLTGAVDR